MPEPIYYCAMGEEMPAFEPCRTGRIRGISDGCLELGFPSDEDERANGKGNRGQSPKAIQVAAVSPELEIAQSMIRREIIAERNGH
jgi:hypothetical protein